MFGPVLRGQHVTLRPADDSDPPRMVPWFADIPILGWLFKNRRENDDRTELLIFITPRIVRGG